MIINKCSRNLNTREHHSICGLICSIVTIVSLLCDKAET